MRIRHSHFYGLIYRSVVAVSALFRLCLLGVLFLGARGGHRPTLRVSASRWFKVLRWAVGAEEYTKHLLANSSSAASNRPRLV
jgi:hypothetical protein